MVSPWSFIDLSVFFLIFLDLKPGFLDFDRFCFSGSGFPVLVFPFWLSGYVFPVWVFGFWLPGSVLPVQRCRPWLSVSSFPAESARSAGSSD